MRQNDRPARDRRYLTVAEVDNKLMTAAKGSVDQERWLEFAWEWVTENMVSRQSISRLLSPPMLRRFLYEKPLRIATLYENHRYEVFCTC